jgi:hypothetical protein
LHGPLPQLPVIPNDTKFSQQWNLRRIGATNAWATTTGSADVVVAIVGDGVNYNHEDLRENMWRNPGETGLGANGNDKASNGIDDDGNGYVDDVYGIDTGNHDSDPTGPPGARSGTGCASIIGAVATNGKGMAGVNWRVWFTFDLTSGTILIPPKRASFKICLPVIIIALEGYRLRTGIPKSNVGLTREPFLRSERARCGLNWLNPRQIIKTSSGCKKEARARFSKRKRTHLFMARNLAWVVGDRTPIKKASSTAT